MCERIIIHRPIERMAAELGARLRIAREPSPLAGVLDGSQLPVLRYSWKSGQRSVELMRWGLVAHFMETPKEELKFRLVRAEDVNKRSTFRAAFRRKRCLIPVDGFCAARLEGDASVTYAFSRRDGSALHLAGVWDSWTNRQTGEQLHSCAIITTRANALVAPIQSRMPAILDSDLHARWLDEVRTPTLELWQMLRPVEAQGWSMLRVGASAHVARTARSHVAATRAQASSACPCG
ncbi:MAG: response-associated peptidase [Myxococcaceae bacterium]|nr:response-associated peptidase [Myxococcaceae bacterium]